MSGVDHIFLGVVLVGGALTAKVVRESLAELSELVSERGVLRRMTEECRTGAEQQEIECQKMKELVGDLKTELQGLKGQEGKMTRKIDTMQKKNAEKAKHKFKVDVTL